MSDHGLHMYAIVDVRGGVAELTVAEGIQTIHVDWDNIDEDWDAAAQVLDDVDRMTEDDDLPADEAERIRSGIEQVWPERYAKHPGTVTAWHFGDVPDCPEGGFCYGPDPDSGFKIVTCSKCGTDYDTFQVVKND